MFKRIRCFFQGHHYDLNRWHVIHRPGGKEVSEIEAEYICTNCGKLFYRYWPIDYKHRFEKICVPCLKRLESS